MKRSVLVSVLLVALAAPGAACAQLRAGVSYETLDRALAERGLDAAEPRVPDATELPVRIAIVRGQETVATIDVEALAAADAARARFEDRARTLSTTATVARSRDLVTDTAEGPASLALAIHGSVVVVVRAIAPGLDAVEIAALAGAAIASAPLGTIDAPAVAPDLAVGASQPIQLPPGVIAARVVATGGGYARRTPRGWMITRTGDEPISLGVIAVDPLLRAIASR